MSLSGEFFEESEELGMVLPSIDETPTNPRLEQYLDEARAGLKSLTASERESELAELRSHLSSLAEANIELGKGGDAAMVAALAQFGSARDVTDQIVRVRKSPRVQFFQATALCGVAGILTYQAYVSLLIMRTATTVGGTTARYFNDTFANLFLAVTAVALGAFVGKRFPRCLHARAPLGLAATMFVLGNALRYIHLPSFEDILIGRENASFSAMLRGDWWVFPSQLIGFAVPFVLLGWAAQATEYRLRVGRAWIREFLSRIPDSWLGATAVLFVARAFLGIPMMFVQRSQFSPTPTADQVLTTLGFQATLGALVGMMLPMRGWTGPLAAVALSLAYLVLPFLLFPMPPNSSIRHEIVGWTIVQFLGQGGERAAYLVGKKRVARP